MGDVAVKVLSERLAGNSVSAWRFLEESQITGQLQHPGIPPIHQIGRLPDGRPFLAMKLIQGETLSDLLYKRSEPGEQRGRFLTAFESICQAVGYAHEHGVIHRDLKPANVMVGAFGEVQVMDWGLAKLLAHRGGDDPTAPDETTQADIQSLREADEATWATNRDRITRRDSEGVGCRDRHRAQNFDCPRGTGGLRVV
jgi:serine/threonine-protein kinase